MPLVEYKGSDSIEFTVIYCYTVFTYTKEGVIIHLFLQIASNTILTKATNDIPKIDLTFNIAIIIIIGTAVSSIVVAVINNIFQLLMKNRDLKYQTDFNTLQLKIKESDYKYQETNKSFEYDTQKYFKEKEYEYSLKKFQWETYHKNAIEIYTNMLINVGEFLGDTQDLSLYSKAISSIHQAYAFSDKELSDELFLLRFEIVAFNGLANQKGNHVSAMEALEKVALAINRILIKSI